MIEQFQRAHIQKYNYYILEFIKLVKNKNESIVIHVKYIFFNFFDSRIIDMNVLFILQYFLNSKNSFFYKHSLNGGNAYPISIGKSYT